MNEEQAVEVPRWIRQSAAIGWRVLVLVAVLYLFGTIVNQLHLVVLPIAGALFLSTILIPPASWLRRHKVPPALATWIVMLAAIGVIVILVLGLYPSINREFAQLAAQLSTAVDDIHRWLQNGPLHLSTARTNSFVDTVKSRLNDYESSLLKGVLAGVTTILQIIASIILTFVFTFFFVKDGAKITAWFIGLFNPDRAGELNDLRLRAWVTLSGYIRGTAVNGLVNAIVLSLGLIILGVPLVVPIAVLTFFGGFLPIVGAFISGGVATMVALVSQGPLTAGLVVLITIFVHHLEGYIVGPLVLGRAVKLHPLAIILVLTVGSVVGGILGAFIAVPLTALIVSIASYYHDPIHRPPVLEPETGTP